MKPAWQAWIERWLGVDATFLSAAAVHVALILTLVLVLESRMLAATQSNVFWMFGIGCTATSAVLLATWTVCGPGSLAVRCVWAVVLVEGTWLVATSIAGRGSLALNAQAVALFAGSLAVTAAMALRLWRGQRLVRDNGPSDQSEWQLRLIDLLLAMVALALILLARQPLFDLSPVFYRVGSGLHILDAVRCGGAVCAATMLAGVLLLLRDKPRVIWSLIAGACATAIAVLWFGEPIYSTLEANLLIFGGVGLGSLLTTIGTLLPLRAWGWRCVSTRSLPAAKI